MLKRFISYYKPHKKLFLLDLLCAGLLAACDLFYPMITRSMLNDYIPNSKLRALIIWAAALLLIYIVKAGLKYFMQYYGHMVGVYMQSDMRREAFEHLERLPFKYFDNNKTGAIMSRIINDLQEVSELAHHGPEDVILAVLLLIPSFFLMSSINLPLTAIIFAFIPVLIWYAARKRLKMSAAFKESRVETAEINAVLENNIAGIRVSKAFTCEPYALEKFRENDSNFIEAKRKSYKAMAEFFSGNNFIIDVLNIVIFVFGGIFTYKGMITVTDFATFIIFVNIFLTPIKNLINFVEQLQNGMSGFTRFCELIDTPMERNAEDARSLGKAHGDIAFHNVTLSYGDGGKEVLSDISFDIKSGETVALVGPSGSGKTTICHAIPRFYEISGGSITVDGGDIRGYTLSSLRANIGIVTQDVFLFTGTIRENILWGRPNATEAEVEEAAKNANIHDFIMSLPKGYDTFVGERGVKLSGGQKQRISIARAFLKNPPILILDEATSSIDTRTELKIQDAFATMMQGRTSFIVAHRLSTIQSADVILVMREGRVVEQGTHEALLAKGGFYAQLHQAQYAQ